MKTKRVLVEFSEAEQGTDVKELQKKIRKLDTYIAKADQRIKLYQSKINEALDISKKERALVESGLKIMKVQENRSFNA